LSFWQIKLIPYATYLPIPLLAVWLARPPPPTHAPLSKSGVAAIVLGTLIVIGIAGWLLLSLGAPSARRAKAARAPIESCQSTAAVEPLAQLPKGLAVADVNLGPYIVALSDLDVLAAPYHRLDRSILEANRILHGSPQEAERRLKAVGARYVITCKGLDSMTPPAGAPAADLQSLLFADRPPGFLEPVPLAAPTPLKVWRFKP
jgi:hypothetical protein